MGFLIIGCLGGLLSAAATFYMSSSLWLAFLAYSLGGCAITVLAAAATVAARQPREEQWDERAAAATAAE